MRGKAELSTKRLEGIEETSGEAVELGVNGDATNQKDQTVGGHKARKLCRLDEVGTASRSKRDQTK
jgi:hypothetical protein